MAFRKGGAGHTGGVFRHRLDDVRMERHDSYPLGIVKLLGMILLPGNSRHFPDAIATDPTLRRPAPYR
jgi:hypothetical protein